MSEATAQTAIAPNTFSDVLNEFLLIWLLPLVVELSSLKVTCLLLPLGVEELPDLVLGSVLSGANWDVYSIGS